MASGYNGTLYIGVTSRLFDRVMVHKEDVVDGLTQKHRVHRLVYYEMHPTMADAIVREKQLKKWNRLWKVRLIEEINSEWEDLFVVDEGILAKGRGGQAGWQR